MLDVDKQEIWQPYLDQQKTPPIECLNKREEINYGTENNIVITTNQSE